MIAVLLAAGLICLPPSAMCSALPALTAAQVGKVGDLETSLFEHQYAGDSIDARLERLEKMVFGEARTGSQEKRYNQLLEAVPDIKNKNSSAAAATSAGTGQPGAQGSQMPSETSNASEPATQTNNAGQEPSSELPVQADRQQEPSAGGPGYVPQSQYYPSVTALESRLLGKSFAGQPIKQRLARLETKAFGHVSGIDDLSMRVSRLEDYFAQATPGEQQPYYQQEGEPEQSISGTGLEPPVSHSLSGAGQGQVWSNAGAATACQQPGAPPSGVMQPESYQMAGGGSLTPGQGQVVPPALTRLVGQLEKEVYGSKYPGMPLLNRISNLEATVFPGQSPDTQAPLADRVNKLKVALQSKQMNQGGQQGGWGSETGTDYQQGQAGSESSSPPKGHPFLHGLAKALGVAGTLAVGALGAVGTGMMYSGMGYGGYGYSPYGYGGMSPYRYGGLYSGMSPYGYGGMSPYGYGSYYGGMPLSGYQYTPYAYSGLGMW